MIIQDIQGSTINDIHLQDLKTYIIEDWPSGRGDEKQDIQLYWTFRDKVAMIEV